MEEKTNTTDESCSLTFVRIGFIGRGIDQRHSFWLCEDCQTCVGFLYWSFTYFISVRLVFSSGKFTNKRQHGSDAHTRVNIQLISELKRRDLDDIVDVATRELHYRWPFVRSLRFLSDNVSVFPYLVLNCVCCVHRKGISKSALPYRRSVATWLKSSSEDVKDHIFKLAKKGLTPSKIGNYTH